jgi:tRNA A37 methylthiotransferase MiaB
LQLIRKVRFDFIASFSCSVHSDSEAGLMPGKIFENIKKKRQRDVILQVLTA